MNKITKHSLAVALGALALGGAAAPAIAGPLTTIAAFNVDDPTLNGGPGFNFTNNGAASTLTNISSPATNEVSFAYTTPANSYSLGSDITIDAAMTVTATVSTTASTGGGLDVQPLDDVQIAFTTIASDSHGAGHNLLTVDISSTGLVYGLDGGATATMKGDTSSTPAEVVTMSSDYLDFSAATAEGYVVELSGVNPTLGINANDFLNSFTAYGAGQFESNSTGNTGGGTPEPASVMLLGFGALGLVARRRRSSRA